MTAAAVSGQETANTGPERKNGFNPILRIPDPNFDGMHLYAGKSLGGSAVWQWFRLKDPFLSGQRLKVTGCEAIRVCEPAEVARLDEAVDRGALVLVHCYLNDELHIRIGK